MDKIRALHSKLMIICIIFMPVIPSLALSNQESPCKTITYGQIMSEYDKHITRLDEIDEIESYHQHYTANNMKSAHAEIMHEIKKERSYHLKILAKIQSNLDKMEINIGKSMMSSSTGYCMQDGEIKKIVTERYNSAENKTNK